jgi:hypothetical protein
VEARNPASCHHRDGERGCVGKATVQGLISQRELIELDQDT